MPARRIEQIIDNIDIMKFPTKYIISVEVRLFGTPYPIHLNGDEFDDIRKTKESFIQHISGRLNIGLFQKDVEAYSTYAYEKI